MEENENNTNNNDTLRHKPLLNSLEPLPIRSYGDGFNYFDTFNEWAFQTKVKTEPNNLIFQNDISINNDNNLFKKFVPNISVERNKTINSVENEQFQETEISTNLLVANILQQSSNNKSDYKGQSGFHKKPLLLNNQNNINLLGSFRENIIKNEIITKKPAHLKSKMLTELSIPNNENLNTYTPISLPFIRNTNNIQTNHLEVISSSKINDLQHNKEIKINTSVIFEGILNDNKLKQQGNIITPTTFLHLQLPIFLPKLHEISTNSQNKTNTTLSNNELKSNYNNQPNSYTASYFQDLPEGKIGVFLIYKSGKVKLKLDSHYFDVNFGSDCSFSQEVGCFFDSNSEFISLGHCSQRILIIPEVKQMINQNN